MWQFYLPRLPFMTDFPTVAHTIPVYDVWFKGIWASFGWTEVHVPQPRLRRARRADAGRGGRRGRAALALARRRRTGRCSRSSSLVAVSLLAGLHWSEYHLLKAGAANFNQGRYLLPLVGVAGVVLALAVRRLAAAPAGRSRWRSCSADCWCCRSLSLGLVLERFYA